MMKLAVPLTLAAFALGACSMGQDRGASASAAPITGPRVATQQAPYITGSGVVASVTPSPAPLASAGGTGAASTSAPQLYRLGIRMSDGKMQYVDTAASDFRVGDRVALEPGNLIRKL